MGSARGADRREDGRAGVGPEAYLCPLCHREFPAAEMECHPGCPLAGRCRVICCPHCGYEFVDPAPTARRLRRLGDLLRRLRGAFRRTGG